MKDNTLILLIILIVVVAFVALFFWKNGGEIGLPTNIGWENPLTCTETVVEERVEYVTVDNSVNFCEFFSRYPAYIDNRSTNCQLAGGDWVCEANRVGCYNIPVWDYARGCSGTEATLWNTDCQGTDGSWTCNAHEVSCER